MLVTYHLPAGSGTQSATIGSSGERGFPRRVLNLRDLPRGVRRPVDGVTFQSADADRCANEEPDLRGRIIRTLGGERLV
jgi:hypothetical protein